MRLRGFDAAFVAVLFSAGVACDTFATSPSTGIDASADDAAHDAHDALDAADAADAASLPPYTQAVLESRPVVYFRFTKADVTTGTRITNEGSLPGYDGVPRALAFTTDCPFADPQSGCAVFDGASSRVDVDGPVVRFPQKASWTVEGWVKLTRLLLPDSGSTYPPIFYYLGTTNPPRTLYTLAFNVSSGIVLERTASQMDSVTAAGRIAQDLKWHHVAGTYDGAKLTVYRDGFQLAQAAHAGLLIANQGPLVIGASTDGEFRLAASIDETAVYDRALDGAELKKHYDAAPR